jgi:GNAT superfamily N-acetyltransferase
MEVQDMQKVNGQQKPLKKSKKLKLFRNGEVFEDQTKVGYIIYDVEKDKLKKNIIDAFYDDPEAIAEIKKIRMPKKFVFIWISKLFVKQHKRGKGYGADILHALEKKFKDHTVVFGLSPGYLVPTTKIDKLFPFYKNQGYKVINSPLANYGFKIKKALKI